MQAEQLQLLKQFVQLCGENPAILSKPELSFFKEWLLSLGATIPEKEASKEPPKSTEEAKPETASEPMHEDKQEPEAEESEESELELDREGVIEEPDVADQEMGTADEELSEEQEQAAEDKRDEGMAQMRQGNIQAAVNLFTEGIKMNGSCAVTFAKRACAFYKLRRPNAAIKDATRSLELNPDSAASYKWRGLSHKLLGNWEEAFLDLSTAQKLDYSDEMYEALKEIETKAKRIMEHKRRYERKKVDSEAAARRARVKKAQEENEKARKAAEEKGEFGFNAGNATGGMPGGMPFMNELFSDPEILKDLEDPDVQKAFTDMKSNPAAFMQHQSNPKVAKVFSKLQSKFAGKMGGAGPGGMFGNGEAKFDGGATNEGKNGTPFTAPPSHEDLD